MVSVMKTKRTEIELQELSIQGEAEQFVGWPRGSYAVIANLNSLKEVVKNDFRRVNYAPNPFGG